MPNVEAIVISADRTNPHHVTDPLTAPFAMPTLVALHVEPAAANTRGAPGPGPGHRLSHHGSLVRRVRDVRDRDRRKPRISVRDRARLHRPAVEGVPEHQPA